MIYITILYGVVWKNDVLSHMIQYCIVSYVEYHILLHTHQFKYNIPKFNKFIIVRVT